VRIVDLGLLSFGAAEALQVCTVEEVRAGAEAVLFLVEHPPVVTIGRQGGLEHLHASPEALAVAGIELVRCSRGGKITCHFPGQLVAYPVLSIERRPGGLRRFFHDLEEAAVRTARAFGVAGERIQGRAGVWVGARKLASVGVAVRRWVTYHGLALNVGPDVSLFDRITPCGLAGVRPTSLALELAAAGRAAPGMEEVKKACAAAFKELFAPAEMVQGPPAGRRDLSHD